MSCEYELTCKNNDKCFKCVNQRLLKIQQKPWEKQRAANKTGYKTSSSKDLNKEDSWKSLEQEVADSLNNVPSIQNARRSRASGAL
jgi:hypothetical protein